MKAKRFSGAMGRTAAAAVLGLALGLAAVSASAGGRTDYLEEISRTIQVDADAVIVLTNTSGDTEVSSWSASEIRVIARKTVRARSIAEAKEFARDLLVQFDKDGTRRVEVWVEYPDWGGREGIVDLILSKRPTGSVDYEVKAPAGVRVEVHATSGDVWVEDVSGGTAVTVTSGDVNLSEVSGGMVVTATSGDVEVSRAAGTGAISTTSGDVTVIGYDGDLAIGLTTGDVYCQDATGLVTIAGTSTTVSVDNCEGNLAVATSNGAVEITEHRGAVRVETVSGYVEVEIESLEDGDCEIDTSSGDIDLELDEEGSYLFIIETASGEIDVEMPEDMEVVAGRGTLRAVYRGGRNTVRISTLSGDITIEAM